MALVPGSWFLNVTFNDSGDNRSTRTYEMDVATAAAAATAAADMLAALANLTDAVILQYYFAQRYVEDTNLFPIVGNTQVENQAIFTYSIAGATNKSATNTIPGPKQAIFVDTVGAGANIIDTTDAAVIAFRALFQTAGDFFISDGEKVNTLKKGKRRHVKNSGG